VICSIKYTRYLYDNNVSNYITKVSFSPLLSLFIRKKYLRKLKYHITYLIIVIITVLLWTIIYLTLSMVTYRNLVSVFSMSLIIS